MDRIFKTVKRKSGIKLQVPFREDGGTYQVWSFCGIKPNRLAPSRPNVVVGLRRRTDDGRVEGDVIRCDVPLTDIGQVRIGTVWQGIYCRSEVKLEQRKYHVNFDEGSWRFVTFAESKKKSLRGEDLREPYPYDLYPTQFPRDQSPLIEFDLWDPRYPNPADPSYRVTGHLVVPCIEFLSRMYGRSQWVTRALVALPLDGKRGAHAQLIGDPPESVEAFRWWVTLRRKCYNSDAVFLAHLLHDPVTQAAVRYFQRQLEASHVSWRDSSSVELKENEKEQARNVSQNSNGTSGAMTFLEVPPWHRKTATLLVGGYAFNGGQSGLGLRVDGCTDPDGPPIDLHREMDGGVTDACDQSKALRARLARHSKVETEDPGPVESSRDDEAARGSRSHRAKDDRFEVLQKRKVDRAQKGAGEFKGSTPGDTKNRPKRYAGSESRGRDKNTGYLSLSAADQDEIEAAYQDENASHGLILDMWYAFRRIGKTNPDVIESVEFFTFQQGVVDAETPRLIALQPFKGDERLSEAGEEIPTSPEMRRWYKLKSGKRRGVLVVRIRTRDKSVCIVEIEREPSHIDGQGRLVEAKGSCGLAFPIEPDFDFEAWLLFFLDDIRPVRGVLGNLKGGRSFPQGGYAFAHVSSKGSKAKPKSEALFPCQFQAHHALRCVGIDIPLETTPSDSDGQ